MNKQLVFEFENLHGGRDVEVRRFYNFVKGGVKRGRGRMEEVQLTSDELNNRAMKKVDELIADYQEQFKEDRDTPSVKALIGKMTTLKEKMNEKPNDAHDILMQYNKSKRKKIRSKYKRYRDRRRPLTEEVQ